VHLYLGKSQNPAEGIATSIMADFSEDITDALSRRSDAFPNALAFCSPSRERYRVTSCNFVAVNSIIASLRRRRVLARRIPITSSRLFIKVALTKS